MTFIIYSKSGCINCNKAKLLLQNYEYVVINCDLLISTNRQEFIKSMENKMNGNKLRQFPIIFHKGDYIGSYNELVEYIIFLEDDNEF